jgi:uncharacterized protein (TIGR02145 family)
MRFGVSSNKYNMKEVYTYRGFTGVKIGDQFWMNKNLDVGEGIEDPNYPKFGKYYTLDQALKVIPEGWRLPSNEDWEELKKFLGIRGDSKLKNNKGWQYYDSNNDEKFNALPGGFYRPEIYSSDYTGDEEDDEELENNIYKNGIFQYRNDYSYFITSSIPSKNTIVVWSLKAISLEKEIKDIKCSFNVRCIQDWNVVKEWLNENQDIDNIELDDLDEINESKKFFIQSERFL